MSVISLPPTHVSLFAPPKVPRWMDAVLLAYACVIAGVFGFVARGFGTIAFHHPSDPHADAGMIVAGVCFVIAMVARFTASQCFARLTR
ncbi:MAG: hypothetical protein RSP_05120 [Rhodanobacter sp.]